MAIAILATLSPLVSMAAAEAIARWHGCELAVESVKPCLAGGEDIGTTLHVLVSMGWFLFATLPAFITVAAVWLFVEAVRWVRRRRGSDLAG